MGTTCTTCRATKCLWRSLLEYHRGNNLTSLAVHFPAQATGVVSTTLAMQGSYGDLQPSSRSTRRTLVATDSSPEPNRFARARSCRVQAGRAGVNLMQGRLWRAKLLHNDFAEMKHDSYF
eukprot:Gb_32642 [translate_table: standard]